MTHPDSEALTEANRRAWDLVARKYEASVESDIELLATGNTTLLAAELEALAPLLPRVRRAVHLQCSHGSDALSLWVLGATEVIGADFSPAMLELARRKSEALNAP